MKNDNKFYVEQKKAVAARLLIKMSIVNGPKKCDICSHSAAAHVDGVRCALCGCTSEKREFVQQTSFSFRTTLTPPAHVNARKR